MSAAHTHRQRDKINTYRAVGVGELWDLATKAVERLPIIHHLLAKGGPRATDRSMLLLGVCAERLPSAAAYLRRIGGLIRFSAKLAKGERVDLELLEMSDAQEQYMDGPPNSELPF